MGPLQGALDGFNSRWLHLLTELNEQCSALKQTTVPSATDGSFRPMAHVALSVLPLK
jgi:hypothetical protein